MNQPCVAFADGQAVVFGTGEIDFRVDLLADLFANARQTLTRARAWARNKAVFHLDQIKSGSPWSAVDQVHAHLLDKFPINTESGFEGNPGVEGGVWRPTDRGEDGLVHLRFSAGTEDLPLHIHEFSDRLIVVTSGVGLFHYLPDTGKTRELRSIVVEPGDVLLFTRGLIHTFTAPIGDLTLLSYHSPFFALDDSRQFTIPIGLQDRDFAWSPQGVVRPRNTWGASRMAPAHDFATTVR